MTGNTVNDSFLNKYFGGVSPMHRIGAGCFMATLCLIGAAVVTHL